MNTKAICYPEVFFERFLREEGVSIYSTTTLLGTTSTPVTNEYFLKYLKEKLQEANLVTGDDDVKAEFSYLEFRHTPYTDLLTQESILGKGGFTLTVAAGSKFVNFTFEPTARFGRKFYVNAHMNAKKEYAPPRSAWISTDLISTGKPEHVYAMLFDHIVAKFVLLKS